MDKTYFSFGDARVTYRDLESVSEGHWLTDNVINFMVEYHESELRSDVKSFIAIVGPSVVQMLKFLKPEEFTMLDSLDLKSKRLIFFPLNDSACSANKGPFYIETTVAFSRIWQAF